MVGGGVNVKKSEIYLKVLRSNPHTPVNLKSILLKVD